MDTQTPQSIDWSIIIVIVQIVVAGLVGYAGAAFRLGRFTQKIEALEQDNKDEKAELKEIRDKVIACETSLKEREPLTKRKSPVDLTDRGNKVLEDSSGKKFVDDHYVELAKKVEEKNPTNSYDIQEASREVIESLENDARINEIKEYLFKEGMKLEDIIDVLGIYLRNLILQKKGIQITDIDNHEKK